MTNPIFTPAPAFIGDFLTDNRPTELTPRFIRRSGVKGRWGMGDKALKTLMDKGILTPHIEQGNLVLFDFADIQRLERDGWNGTNPPCEAYPNNPNMEN